MAQSPGFTCVVVVTLALGIGLNTSLFSIANTFLWRALPYPNGSRLIEIFGSTPENRYRGFSVPAYEALTTSQHGFAHLAAMHFTGGGTLTEAGRLAEVVDGVRVTPSFLPTLGIQPLLGRNFTAAEDVELPNVVLISHSFWQRRFGGDPQILGRRLQLTGRPVTIIGVLPPESAAPLVFGNVDVWLPLGLTPGERGYIDNLDVIAALAPGDTMRQTQARLAVIAPQLVQSVPRNDTAPVLRAVPLQATSLNDTGRAFIAATAGLALTVLLIACANLANLQLARAAARSREFAIRIAVGATRWRLLRLAAIESLLLAIAGGGGALYVATIANAVVGTRYRHWNGTNGQEFALDWHTLLFTGGIALGCACFFGVLPTWLATRRDPTAGLRESGRGQTLSLAGRRFRSGLIVAEFTVSLVLLSGTCYLLSGLHRFMARDVGWDTRHIAFAATALPVGKYQDAAAQKAQFLEFYRVFRERAATLPGVESAAVGWMPPLWNYGNDRITYFDANSSRDASRAPHALYNGVSPDYFQTLGIALLAGRDFDEHDTGICLDEAPGDQVCIVNESLARTLDPQGNVLDRLLYFGDPARVLYRIRIVGVVRDVQFACNLTPAVTRFQIYRPLAQEPWPFSHILLRTQGDPRPALESLRRLLADIDPDQPLAYSADAPTSIANATANLRLISTLLGAVALLGLFLALLGLYAVIAQNVTRRTGEIGIRLALGAQVATVVRAIVGDGLRLVGLGCVLGILGTLYLARVLAAQLPLLPSGELWLMAALTALMVVVALVACWLPARRAAGIDPVVALRTE